MMPRKEKENLKLQLTAIAQGIEKKSGFRGWRDAQNCHYDVNCAIGSGWEKERDAVGLLMINQTHLASGFLINTECQNLIPYFMTAFHNLDYDENKSLSGSESNPLIYSVKFKYESTNPECPGLTNNPEVSTWFTYSVNSLKSAHATTDHVLLLLNGSLSNYATQTALAGWDRSGTASSNIASIHHPKTDANKISKDAGTISGANVSDGGLTIECWMVDNWDYGALEPGSSGAPLFNSSKQVIGQLWGYDSIQNVGSPCGPNSGAVFSKFDKSWTGGGTNSTRVSNWLTGPNTVSSVNTIRTPYINTSGNNFVCTTNKTISLENPIPGKSVTWSVTPNNLFAKTSGASVSGSSANATVRSVGTSGSASITFTQTSTGCDPIIISLNLWVGAPITEISESGYLPIETAEVKTIYVTSVSCASSFNANWSVTGILSLLQPTFGNWNQVQTYSTSGFGSVYAANTNVCGTASSVVNYYVPSGLKVKVYPTIAKDLVNIDVASKDEKLEVRTINQSVRIYTSLGRLCLSARLRSKSDRLYIGHLQTGIYFIETEINGTLERFKIFKL